MIDINNFTKATIDKNAITKTENDWTNGIKAFTNMFDIASNGSNTYENVKTIAANPIENIQSELNISSKSEVFFFL